MSRCKDPGAAAVCCDLRVSRRPVRPEQERGAVKEVRVIEQRRKCGAVASEG